MRVQQVLLNLLTNAIKFSKQDSDLYVKTKIERNQDDPTHEIQVIDSGVGMTKEDLSNLFTPFFRSSSAQNREMNQGSHGLGLSICKKIAEKLDGNITCRSKLNVGTIMSFKFKAPFIDTGHLSQAFKNRSRRTLKKMKRLNSKKVSKLGEIAETEYEESSETGEEDADSIILNEAYQSGETRQKLTDGIKIDSGLVAYERLSRIIVAEDQIINLTVIKNQISDLYLTDCASFLSNGKDTIDKVKEILETDNGSSDQPISLMLLDF